MSKERITKALKGFGFSTIETRVYFFLAKQGAHTIKEIALALNLSENKIDRSLQELLGISIIKASIENPLEFVAVPFEEVIDLFIQVKKEQAKTLQKNRKELLSNWRETIKKEIVKNENF
jgi:sugar-specific transcriptional regulator TrmB